MLHEVIVAKAIRLEFFRSQSPLRLWLLAPALGSGCTLKYKFAISLGIHLGSL